MAGGVPRRRRGTALRTGRDPAADGPVAALPDDPTARTRALRHTLRPQHPQRGAHTRGGGAGAARAPGVRGAGAGAAGHPGGVGGLLRHGAHRVLRRAQPPHAAPAHPGRAAALPGGHARAGGPGVDPRRRRADRAGRAGPGVRRPAAGPVAARAHAAGRARAAGRRAAGRPPLGGRPRTSTSPTSPTTASSPPPPPGLRPAGGGAAGLRGRRVPAAGRAGDHRPVHDPHARGGGGRGGVDVGGGGGDHAVRGRLPAAARHADLPQQRHRLVGRQPVGRAQGGARRRRRGAPRIE